MCNQLISKVTHLYIYIHYTFKYNNLTKYLSILNNYNYGNYFN